MTRLDDLLASGSTRTYKKGQIVLYQGEETQNVFRIKSGFIKVYDIDTTGKEKILLILGVGNIFPVISSIRAKGGYYYFYQTLTDTKLDVTPRQEFRKQLLASHDSAIDMLEYFATLTNDLFARIACIEATNARSKIAQVLSYLVTHHNKKSSGRFAVIHAPLTHQIIADMAGVVRETASVQLKKCEEKKIISWGQDKALVVNKKRLEKLVTTGEF
jgi:CRP/FNR family transcriptional regulator